MVNTVGSLQKCKIKSAKLKINEVMTKVITTRIFHFDI